MTNDDHDTIALVTGANKGIGREIALQLGRLGMSVLVGSRDATRGDKAAAELRQEGVSARHLPLDVTDGESIAAAATRVEDWFGRLDVLVNNAGITGSDRRPPGELPVEVVRTVYETNVFGVIAVTNAFLPLLRRSPSPRIVNVSSEVGSLTLMSNPDWEFYDLISVSYPTSKTALNAVTVQFAKALAATGIKVNAVSPGYCATDLNGHQGYRSAEQGANIAVELATVGPDGPTGGFFDDNGPISW